MPIVRICAPRYQRPSTTDNRNMRKLFSAILPRATKKNFMNCLCAPSQSRLENVQNFWREKLIRMAAAKAALIDSQYDRWRISRNMNRRERSAIAVIPPEITLFQKHRLLRAETIMVIHGSISMETRFGKKRWYEEPLAPISKACS